MCHLRAAWAHFQRDWPFAPSDNFPLGVVYPVVEGVGLVQPRTVLLNASPPNVLVGIEVQGLAPVVDRCLEIADLALLRLVAASITHAEPKQCGRVLRVERGRARKRRSLHSGVAPHPTGPGRPRDHATRSIGLPFPPAGAGPR